MPISRERQDYVNAWKRAHPERRSEYQRRVRLRKYRPQYERQYGLCYYCAEELSDVYHVEHVIPQSAGGTDAPNNIVLACPSCNLAKGRRTDWHPTEVIPVLCCW